jgi:TDG/mug DNA glycosylase family protein
VGFSRADLQAFVDASVPDLVGPGLRLLFVGINPGLWTAATQTHFAHPGNRFYPALRLAGIIDREISRADGMTDDDRAYLVARGLGNTNLVNRATARADELTADELRAGAARLRELVAETGPAWLAVVGVTAYRTAFDAPRAVVGPQAERLGAARMWVLPNPSGLNAHWQLPELAAEFARLRAAVGG